MTIDPYSLCPCASGKKVKFCCGASIGADLDKILRMVEGEQRVAALDHLNRVVEKQGPLPCLLSLKVGIELDLNEIEKAIQSAAEYLRHCPDSADALAYSALIEVLQGNVKEAIDKLHRALSVDIEIVPASATDALQALIRVLMMHQGPPYLFAALGHIRLTGAFTEEENETLTQLLGGIDQSPQAPALFKQYRSLVECPEGVAWRDQFDDALTAAAEGRWLAAIDKFTALDKTAPRQKAVLRNLAMLQGWIHDAEASVNSWRKLSRIPNLTIDEAVEAEALAQLLDMTVESRMVDELRLTYPVKDADALMERLLSHKLVSQMPVDLSSLVAEGEPLPRGAFWLLDKPLPEASDDLTSEQIPVVLGELVVFGKQTDRDALVFATVQRTDDYWLKTTAAAEALGQFAGPSTEELVMRQLPSEVVALSSRWRFPESTPTAVQRRLVAERRRQTMMRTWPETPRGVLRGKTPREAAADPDLKPRVQALLLLYELQTDTSSADIDFNALREELGLPRREKIAIKDVDLDEVPLVRIPYVDLEHASNDQLTPLLMAAVSTRFHPGVRALAAELLRRGGIDGQLEVYQLHGALAQTATDAEETLEHLHNAQQAAIQAQKSPAPFLIRELDLRMRRLEVAECQTLIQRIQSQHLQEEGVNMALYQILLKHRVSRPDGSPAGMPAPPRAQPAAASASPPPGSQLWTPESPTASPEAGGPGKSKLWVPGMD